MVFWVPIIVLIATIFGGYTFWITIQAVSAVVQILSIIITIVTAPFLIKFIADVIMNRGFGISKEVSILLGISLSIPILVVLYMNLWSLIIFGMIMGMIYAIARFYGTKNIMSLTKWFKKK